jgi:hypothetical protein
MIRLTYRRKDTFLGIGGLISALGGFLAKMAPHYDLVYTGYTLTAVGLALVAYGTIGVLPRMVLMDQWNPKALETALADAPHDATIRILQTSIPDVTRLIGLLEHLLIHDKKQFRLKVLLLDYEKAPDLLLARVRLRVETAGTHIAEIQADTDQFIKLKERVDAVWEEKWSGAKLNLQIRYYTFLPFGSVFQIGEEKILSGFFWNWTSSINGPMVVLADKESNAWKCFERHLTMGWDQARQIYPAAGATSQGGAWAVS